MNASKETAMFIVQVKAENQRYGCYIRSFDKLNDDVRSYISSKASSLRKGGAQKCVAVILRNGSALSTARIIDC